jgi:ribosomal protein S18 acetylase RimI-like enzyme
MVESEARTRLGERQRSYIVMRAETQEALKLAAEWWKQKEVSNNVKVHRLRKNEMGTFVDLYNRCFLVSPDPFCPLTIDDAKRLETEGIFVAELWGVACGFIACFIEKSTESTYGEITGIGVLPHHRRKGVATALIRRATKYFLDAGVSEVYCEVYEENEPSKLLITAYGFKEVSRRLIRLEAAEDATTERQYPGGKIMRRLGLRPRPGCESCRDI